jgi:hypothetical protein
MHQKLTAPCITEKGAAVMATSPRSSAVSAAADVWTSRSGEPLLRVASDTAATPQEREHAYALARTELDGLIVLPERGIVGEIDGVGRPSEPPRLSRYFLVSAISR